MSLIVPGAFIVHAKLPELGSGEILSVDQGAMRVRFASGERSFLTSMVEQHLTVTIEGPAPAAKAKPARSKRKAAAKPV